MRRRRRHRRRLAGARRPVGGRGARLHRQARPATSSNFMVRAPSGSPGVVDTQCGFKLFRRGGGASLFGAGRHRRLRLRRRAAAARAAPRLSRCRGRRQLGRSARLEGRRASRDGPRMCREVLAARARLGRADAARRTRVIADAPRRSSRSSRSRCSSAPERSSAQGIDVIHLESGEPDFDTPSVIREAAREGAQGRPHAATRTPSAILPLREAIAEHYRDPVRRRRSRRIRSSSPPGPRRPMLLLFGALLERGRRGRALRPALRLLSEVREVRGGGAGVRADRPRSDGFQFRPEAVGGGADARGRRAILVNSPANPTGAVLAPDRHGGARRRLRARGSSPTRSTTASPTRGRDHTILEFTDRAFVLNGFSRPTP